jgi:hypothetical protein
MQAVERCGVLEELRPWMMCPSAAEQLNLAGFSRELKAGVVVREDVRAVVARGPVEPQRATLGQDNGTGAPDGRHVGRGGLPAGAQPVHVAFDQRVKGEDHRAVEFRMRDPSF